VIKTQYEVLEELLVVQELQVPRAADEGIEVALDVENDIYPWNLAGLDRAQQIVDHLADDFLLLIVFEGGQEGFSVLFDPSRTVRHVFVLWRSQKCYFFELIELLLFGQLVEEGLPLVLVVLHGQLKHRVTFFEVIHVP
jgi:hypothetical protein